MEEQEAAQSAAVEAAPSQEEVKPLAELVKQEAASPAVVPEVAFTQERVSLLLSLSLLLFTASADH